MKISIKKTLLLSFIIVCPFVLSGCLPGAGPQGEEAPDTGEFVKGAIAKGFPENLPIYENAQIAESYASPDSFGAAFITADDLVKVIEFYSAALPQLGWESSLRQVSSSNYVFDIKSDTHAGTVTVNATSEPKTSGITISVAKR